MPTWIELADYAGRAILLACGAGGVLAALVSMPRDERNHRRVNELMRLIDEINRR